MESDGQSDSNGDDRRGFGTSASGIPPRYDGDRPMSSGGWIGRDPEEKGAGAEAGPRHEAPDAGARDRPTAAQPPLDRDAPAPPPRVDGDRPMSSGGWMGRTYDVRTDRAARREGRRAVASTAVADAPDDPQDFGDTVAGLVVTGDKPVTLETSGGDMLSFAARTTRLYFAEGAFETLAAARALQLVAHSAAAFKRGERLPGLRPLIEGAAHSHQGDETGRWGPLDDLSVDAFHDGTVGVVFRWRDKEIEAVWWLSRTKQPLMPGAAPAPLVLRRAPLPLGPWVVHEQRMSPRFDGAGRGGR